MPPMRQTPRANGFMVEACVKIMRELVSDIEVNSRSASLSAKYLASALPVIREEPSESLFVTGAFIVRSRSRTNDRGERPPPTGTVERTRRVRIAARRRAE